MNVLREYERILRCEFQLRPPPVVRTWAVFSAIDIRNQVMQLDQIAKSAFVSRSYNDRYGLYHGDRVYESVAAHSLLFQELALRALRARYGFDFGDPESEFPRTVDGYSLNELVAFFALHDLPENETGDLPDNGARDEQKKHEFESAYYQDFVRHYPEKSEVFKRHVLRLATELDDPQSPTTGVLRASDKVAAIFTTLCQDSQGYPPLKRMDDRDASKRDREEMHLCDYTKNGYYRASEMWTMDHIKMRHTIDYDDTGFLAAIIIMYTLLVHGQWYSWRESDYLKTPAHT